MPFLNRGGLEPGDRDRWITIEAATDGVDAVGAPIEVWTPIVSLPATKLDLETRERLQSGAARIASAFDTRWQINYRADMDPELQDVAKGRRIIHNGRRHDIVGAVHLGRKDGIEFLTTASTAEGA